MIGLIFLGGLLFAQVGAAQSCPADCTEYREQTEKLDKTIQRLAGIKTTNEEYLATLGPSQDSQRMKANSNIKIAEKRISEAEAKKKEFEQKKTEKNCLSCEKG